ncbi:MAG: hypothetical protein U1E31_02125 [Rickettsiales bacterium]
MNNTLNSLYNNIHSIDKNNLLILKNQNSKNLKRDIFTFIGGFLVTFGTTFSTFCMISIPFYQYLSSLGIEIDKGEDPDAHPLVLFSTYISMSVASFSIFPRLLSKKPIVKINNKTIVKNKATTFNSLTDSILINANHNHHQEEESDWKFAIHNIKKCKLSNVVSGSIVAALYLARSSSIIVLPIYSVKHINQFTFWDKETYATSWLIIISISTILIFPYTYKNFIHERGEFLEIKEHLSELKHKKQSKLIHAIDIFFFFILPIFANSYAIIFEFFAEYQYLMQKLINSIDLHRDPSKQDLPTHYLATDILAFSFALAETFRGANCKEKIITILYAIKETFESIILVPIQLGRLVLYPCLTHTENDPAFIKEFLYLVGSTVTCFAKLGLFILCAFVAATLNPRMLLGSNAKANMHNKYDIKIYPDPEFLGVKLEHWAHHHLKSISTILINISEFYGVIVSVAYIFNIYRLDFSKNLVTKKIADSVNCVYNFMQGTNHDRNQDTLDTIYKFIEHIFEKLYKVLCCKRAITDHEEAYQSMNKDNSSGSITEEIIDKDDSSNQDQSDDLESQNKKLDKDLEAQVQDEDKDEEQIDNLKEQLQDEYNDEEQIDNLKEQLQDEDKQTENKNNQSENENTKYKKPNNHKNSEAQNLKTQDTDIQIDQKEIEKLDYIIIQGECFDSENLNLLGTLNDI